MATDPTGRIQLQTGYLAGPRPKLARAAAAGTVEAAAPSLDGRLRQLLDLPAELDAAG